LNKDQTEPAKLSPAAAPTLEGTEMVDLAFLDEGRDGTRRRTEHEERETARIRRLVEKHKQQEALSSRRGRWRRRTLFLLLALAAASLFVVVRRLGLAF
jgi:hypothetical protein